MHAAPKALHNDDVWHGTRTVHYFSIDEQMEFVFHITVFSVTDVFVIGKTIIVTAKTYE